MKRKKGIVFIISGPSGVGKGTIIKEVLKEKQNIYLTISATTRKPRGTEKHGRDYFFLSEEEFTREIGQNKFIEWCNVHESKYGTYYSQIEENINKGKNVLLEVDTQGAGKVISKLDNAVSIFLVPPQWDELVKRLKNRNTENASSVSIRLEKAKAEMQEMKNFNYVVVNDILNQAVKDILKIMTKYDRVEKEL
ncbi:guanylate kinase [Candidatus Margulisiibacteriota bacterium]